MKLYDKIKKLAEERNVSIYRIERDLGLSNGAISKWNESKPNISNMAKVAGYLDVNIEQLLLDDLQEIDRNRNQD